MIPRLVERGYKRGHSTALVACSGILGQLIPPSVPMIFYAIITGNSILGVWFSTIGPGIVIILMYILLNALMTRKMPIVREPKAASFGDYVVRLGQTGKSSFPVVLLPVLIFTSLYSGLITPTEVAVLGVVYVVAIGYFYRALNWSGIKEAMISTAVISGAVTLMFYFTETASRILIMEGITEEMGKFIVAHSPSQAATLLMLNIILLLMGMMMNDLSGTVLSAGLLWPIAQVAGIDPYHFAAITGVNLGLGTVTPAHRAHALSGREDRQLSGRGV